MASMDGASIITDVADEYGLSDASSRARILRWVNRTQRDIWAMPVEFWFRHTETTFTFTAGQDLYTLNAAYAGVDAIMDQNGLPLAHIPVRTFKQLYRQDSRASTNAKAWTEESWDSSGKIIRVRVRPVPAATTNGLIRYNQRVSDLTDSSSSYSIIPEEYRVALTHGALKQMCLANGHAERAASYDADYQKTIQKMIGDTEQRNRGAF